jgi:tetratricopeptide (TPR) repeat protein
MNSSVPRQMARRFELARRLGAGGMAVVYDAVDLVTGARVALKVLSSIDSSSRARFKREFRAMQDVQHPNLVRLHELYEDDDQLFFTMDLIEGVDFLSFVRGEARELDADTLPLAQPGASPGAPRGEEPPATMTCDELRLRDALAQLVRAVTALHDRALVHRDIKPSNILVMPDGALRLLDFGLISDPALYQSTMQQVLGTAGYMAPEQAGDGPVGPPADWYSVGVLLFEALTGQRPYTGPAVSVIAHKRLYDAPAPSAMVFGVPPDLDRLCERLLARDPEQRPDGREIAAALGVNAPAAARPAARTMQPRRTNDGFVGRIDERHWLRREYDRTRTDGAVAVSIEGESGIGKTTLVQQFIDDLRAEDPELVVLRGRCYERESVAYKGIDGLVESLQAFLRRLPDVAAAALAPRHSGALTLQFPALASIPALTAGASAARLQDPQVARTQAMHALRELLLRLTDRYRLVLWLDDLHWMDRDGRLVLDELVRPPDAPSALLVVTRPIPVAGEPIARLPCGESTLALGPLAGDDAGSLVAVCAQRAGVELDGALVSEIVDEAHGHPIFLLELVHHAGRREPARSGPVLLDDVLWERVAGLAPEPRALLEVTAAAGSPVPVRVAAAAAGLDLGGALSWLAQLRAERLLLTNRPGAELMVLPAHDRVRRTVLGHLDDVRIVGWHSRIADALESSGVLEPERLAMHWTQAGDLVRAAPHAQRAAFAAARAFAFDRAVSLFQTAIAGTSDPSARHELLVAQGEALANAGRGADAARTFLVCAAASASAEHVLELRHRAADQLLRSGYIDEGLDVFHDVLSAVRVRLPRTPRAALASLIYHRARLALRGLSYVERAESEVPAAVLQRLDVCWSVGSGLSLVDMVRGADFQARCLLLALDAGEPQRLARALANEASIASSEGGRSRRRVKPLLEAARAQARKSGHPNAAGWLALAQGIVSVQEGRFEDGLQHASEAATIFRDRCQGSVWELTSARAFSIWSLVLLGRLRELAETLPDLVRDSRDRGDRLGLVSLTSGPIHVLGLARDDAGQMREDCRDGLSRWAQGGFHFQHLCGLFTLVAADLYEGLTDVAVEYLESKWKEVEDSLLLRVQFFRLDLWALRGRVALAAARHDARSPHVSRVEQAIARIEREQMAWASGHALALRAGLARLRGDLPLAVRWLERAERDFASAAMAVHAGACLLQRGMLLGADGAHAFERGSALLVNQGVRRPTRFATTLLPVAARD